jgi:hypothetical protein
VAGRRGIHVDVGTALVVTDAQPVRVRDQIELAYVTIAGTASLVLIVALVGVVLISRRSGHHDSLRTKLGTETELGPELTKTQGQGHPA